MRSYQLTINYIHVHANYLYYFSFFIETHAIIIRYFRRLCYNFEVNENHAILLSLCCFRLYARLALLNETLHKIFCSLASLGTQEAYQYQYHHHYHNTAVNHNILFHHSEFPDYY